MRKRRLGKVKSLVKVTQLGSDREEFNPGCNVQVLKTVTGELATARSKNKHHSPTPDPRLQAQTLGPVPTAGRAEGERGVEDTGRMAKEGQESTPPCGGGKALEHSAPGAVSLERPCPRRKGKPQLPSAVSHCTRPGWGRDRGNEDGSCQRGRGRGRLWRPEESHGLPLTEGLDGHTGLERLEEGPSDRVFPP